MKFELGFNAYFPESNVAGKSAMEMVDLCRMVFPMSFPWNHSKTEVDVI
jgi:hypothetical protein